MSTTSRKEGTPTATTPAAKPGGGPRPKSPRPDAKGTRSSVRIGSATAEEEDEITPIVAKEILRKAGYLTHDAPLTHNRLAFIIRQYVGVAHKIPKALADGLKAVAVLIEDVEEDSTTIAAQVIAAIADPIERMSETAQQLSTLATKTEQAIVRLSADRPGGAAQPETPGSQQATRPTYAAVTQVQVPPRHAEVLARSQGREKQVLIDSTSATSQDGLRELTERELVVKANTTVELMGELAVGKPEGGELFVGAQKLQRGGIIYVMRTVAAAEWLRQADIREKFMSFFGGQGRMRERGCVIVLKFVPVTFEPSSPSARRRVEEENEMRREEIVEAKWLKDRDKRTQGQRTAFALLTIRTAQAANKILREGMVVEGKRVFAHKNVPEAKRCMKCQGFRGGHMAAECKSIHEMCARCGEQHWTADCKNNGARFCHNCMKAGHMASDRNCPIFKEECRKLASRNPESKYRYFPVTDDPSTWELKEGEVGTASQGSREAVAGAGVNGAQAAKNEGNPQVGREGPQIRSVGGFHFPEGVTAEMIEGSSRGMERRGGAPPGRSRGRTTTFTPPIPDRGWVGQGITTAREVHRVDEAQRQPNETTNGGQMPDAGPQPIRASPSRAVAPQQGEVATPPPPPLTPTQPQVPIPHLHPARQARMSNGSRLPGTQTVMESYS
jgi:hypothetical protein